MSFIGLLQVAFIVLKLTAVIDWSWWWVLSPSFVGVFLLIVAFVLSLWAGAFDKPTLGR